MPFLATDEEELGPKGISGSSVVNQQQMGKPEQKARSGSFTNLQDYLNANKEQSAAMGQKVASDVDTAAQTAKADIDTFQSSAPKPVTSYDQESLNTSFYKNPNANKDDYQKLKSTGGYEGPSSVEQAQGYEAATKNTEKASEKLGKLGTYEGRSALLGESYGNENVSAGAGRLNTSLISRDPTARQAGTDTASQWSGLTGMLDTAKQGVTGAISQGQKTATDNRAMFPKAEQTAVSSLIDPIEQMAKEYNESIPTKIESAQNELSRSAISPEMLSSLGLQSGANIYDINLSDYLNPNLTQASANDVATGEQRQQWESLMDLLGIDDNRIAKSGAQLNPYSFDTARLSSDLATKAPLDQEIQNISNKKYGGGGGGGFEIAPSGSMQEMLNMGLTPDEYYKYKNTYTSRGMLPEVRDQMRADYERLTKINRKVKSTSDNVINTPTGGITGGLKG